MKNESHKNKMQRKAKERDLRHRSTPAPLVLANISSKHPDYGMSPQEHEAAKQDRLHQRM